MWGRTAFYVDKILKGANPANLPVEQPAKFELTINLRTAKTLGFDISSNLLSLADELIDYDVRYWPKADIGRPLPTALFEALPSALTSGFGMRRREFITFFGGAAVWPLTAYAQQPVAPVIGFLSSRSPGESASVVAAFRQGLRETGFIEGQNLGIAFRWAEGRYDKLPALASELVSLPVTLLFAAGGPPSAFAAKSATSTIPVVFSGASDPVEIGLVPSLNQPGGNVTGMAIFSASLGTKRLELMKELMPNAGVIGYLLNPAHQKSEIETKSVVAAAGALGIDVRILNATSESELETVFAGLQEMRIRALVVSGEPFLDSQRERIVGLAARYAVAAIYAWREYVLAGGS